MLRALSLLGLAAPSAAVGVDEWPLELEIPDRPARQAERETQRQSPSPPSLRRRAKSAKSRKARKCDLENYPQWREEAGYWIGDLSFYGPEGAPFESASWNYPYDSYRGFITGNIAGRAYRQRNVFFYPPQTAEGCATDVSTTGAGTCGANGNSKLFEADQAVPDELPARFCDGTLEGPFAGVFDTKTTLVGDDSALLYQVFFQGLLSQSQLTTLTAPDRRTRTAQGYNPFGPSPEVPVYSSFYRERRVGEEEFYDALNATLAEYGMLEEDVCSRDSQGNLVAGVVGGMAACRAHLDESFQLL